MSGVRVGGGCCRFGGRLQNKGMWVEFIYLYVSVCVYVWDDKMKPFAVVVVAAVIFLFSFCVHLMCFNAAMLCYAVMCMLLLCT